MKVQVEDHNYYLDDKLLGILDNYKKEIRDDSDKLFVVDGPEGAGKSVFTFQIAKYMDPSFNIDRVAFFTDEFLEMIMKSEKYQAIVFDESVTGAMAQSWAEQQSKLLKKIVATVRQKNLVLFFVIPSFFELQRNFALHRASALFHVYKNKEGRRGFFLAYGRQHKNQLYQRGRAYLSYSRSFARWDINGRFTKHYAVDEVAYRKKKLEAFEQLARDEPKKESVTLQRMKARVYCLIKELRNLGYYYSDISKRFDENVLAKWDKKSISNFTDDYAREKGFEGRPAGNINNLNGKTESVKVWKNEKKQEEAPIWQRTNSR